MPYYERFVAEFPDVRALAAAPLDARARAVERARLLPTRASSARGGAARSSPITAARFPADAATLATLPGIGRSTAAAIAAFASGERGAILDGNVKRVLARHRGIDGWPGAPGVEAKLWRAAEALLPRRATSTYTQALMDLGATVCTRARPRCDACPIADDCVALHEHRIDALPSPRPRKPLPHREVRVLVLERDGMILLEQRPPLGIWGGLWSLPELPMDADVRVRNCIAVRRGCRRRAGAAADRPWLHALRADDAPAASSCRRLAGGRPNAGDRVVHARGRDRGCAAGTDTEAASGTVGAPPHRPFVPFNVMGAGRTLRTEAALAFVATSSSHSPATGRALRLAYKI